MISSSTKPWTNEVSRCYKMRTGDVWNTTCLRVLLKWFSVPLTIVIRIRQRSFHVKRASSILLFVIQYSI